MIGQMGKADLDITIKFRAPKEAGQYVYNVEMKSQEFLGADAMKLQEIAVLKEPKKTDENEGLETREEGDAVVVDSPKSKKKDA